MGMEGKSPVGKQGLKATEPSLSSVLIGGREARSMLPQQTQNWAQKGKECAQGDGPDGGGTRDNHSGEGTAKAHLFNAKASLLEARRPAAPQSPECLLELP